VFLGGGGLTPKSVLAGTKNSPAEGLWLAKHTSHKHPHHDGAVFPSSGMFLMEENTSPPRASSQGVGRDRPQRVLVESINKGKNNLFLLPLSK
jgi:hypothetical protein